MDMPELILRGKLYNDRAFDLWWLFDEVDRAIMKAREKDLGQYDLTFEQSGILHVLQIAGNEPTLSKISRMNLREPQSVSGIIDRMEKRGLVNKTRCLGKKNMIRVTLTEMGRQAYRNASIRDSIHDIMSVLSEKEYEQLWSCLTVLLTAAITELEKYYRPHFLLPKTPK